MIKNASDDAYQYLKGRWWGKVLIGLICLCIFIFILWAALPASLKERLFASEQPTSASVQTGHFTEEQLNYRNLIAYRCRGTDPHKQYDLARDLEPSHREGEMASIVVDAVCSGDETFALEIFAKLSQTDMRDVAAKGVTSFYINKKKFADANRWAVFLSNLQDRDWWIRRILEISQQAASS